MELEEAVSFQNVNLDFLQNLVFLEEQLFIKTIALCLLGLPKGLNIIRPDKKSAQLT